MRIASTNPTHGYHNLLRRVWVGSRHVEISQCPALRLLLLKHLFANFLYSGDIFTPLLLECFKRALNLQLSSDLYR